VRPRSRCGFVPACGGFVPKNPDLSPNIPIRHFSDFVRPVFVGISPFSRRRQVCDRAAGLRHEFVSMYSNTENRPMPFFAGIPFQMAFPRVRLWFCRTAAAACLLFVAGRAGVAGPITYNFLNYPEFQNGYSLSGSITTDGTLGAIDETHVDAWQFTITGTSISRSVDSTNSGSFAYSNFFATATELRLAEPPTGGATYVGLHGASSTPSQGALLFWQVWATGVPAGSMYYSRTEFEDPLTLFWQTDPYMMSYPDNNWTIAMAASPVPEIDPAGFGSVAALITGALGLIERRRLKAKAA